MQPRSFLDSRWLRIALLIAAPIAAFAVPPTLEEMTAGRASFEETAPWCWAIGVLLVIAWWYLPRRSWKQSAQEGRSRISRSDEVRREPSEAEPRSDRDARPPLPGPRAPQAGGSTALHIFISYRRADTADVAGRMDDRLRARFGRENVFKDVDSIPLGVDYREYVDAQVAKCDVLIAVIGAAWLGPREAPRLHDERDLVRLELESALRRRIPVIPVLVGLADMPEESDLPSSVGSLSYRNAIRVRPDPDFHHDIDRLISGLEQHLQARAGLD